MTDEKKTTAKPSYLKRPSAEHSVLLKYDAIIRAESGQATVTDAAMEAGLSRVQFQNLVNQVRVAAFEVLTPKPGGRPKKEDDEVTKLKAELAHVTKALQARERELEITKTAMLSLVDVVKEHRSSSARPSQRSRSSSTTKTIEAPNDAAEDDRSAKSPSDRGVDA